MSDQSHTETAISHPTINWSRVSSKLKTFFSAILPESNISTTQHSVEWIEEGFSVEDAIKKTNGPLIEVAGPTDEGFEIIDLNKVDRKIYISNLTKGRPIYDDQTGKLLRIEGSVDFQADATKMPIKSKSVGVVFASCLPQKIRKDSLIEIRRVLEDGGYVIWQTGKWEDVVYAKSIGMKLKQYKRFIEDDGNYWYSVILQKPTSVTT